MSIATNSPNVFTSIQGQKNPQNVGALGEALLTGGLVQIVQISGVGLLSFGFVWPGSEIWFDRQSIDGINTGWTAAAGYSGCAAASFVITSWSASQSFGNEFQMF